MLFLWLYQTRSKREVLLGILLVVSGLPLSPTVVSWQCREIWLPLLVFQLHEVFAANGQSHVFVLPVLRHSPVLRRMESLGQDLDRRKPIATLLPKVKTNHCVDGVDAVADPAFLAGFLTVLQTIAKLHLFGTTDNAKGSEVHRRAQRKPSDKIWYSLRILGAGPRQLRHTPRRLGKAREQFHNCLRTIHLQGAWKGRFRLVDAYLRLHRMTCKVLWNRFVNFN